MPPSDYPVTFSVEYPDRDLNRPTTAFRIITVIPIAVILALLSGSWGRYDDWAPIAGAVAGIVFIPTALMILFRKKYPRWWYDWNLELLRFTNRVGVYLLLMDDRYPSTDEKQSVHSTFPTPTSSATSNAASRSSNGCWPSRITWSSYFCTSGSSSPRSVPGSRSSSPVATPAASSTSSKAWSAGTTGSSATPSPWSPTNIRRSG
jgi:hypothetical protein